MRALHGGKSKRQIVSQALSSCLASHRLATMAVSLMQLGPVMFGGVEIFYGTMAFWHAVLTARGI